MFNNETYYYDRVDWELDSGTHIEARWERWGGGWLPLLKLVPRDGVVAEEIDLGEVPGCTLDVGEPLPQVPMSLLRFTPEDGYYTV